MLVAAANSDATNNEKVDIDIEIQEMLPSTVSDTPQEEGTGLSIHLLVHTYLHTYIHTYIHT